MAGGEKQNIDCNYYRVYGWMSTKLKLKGIKKEIYAIIYHYTTTENAKGYFDGSIAYLKQWTLTSSKHTIIEALKNLTDSNFVILVQDNSKIRKPNIYKANLDILSNVSSTEKSLVVSSAKTAPVENITSAKTAPDKCKKCTSTSAKTAPNNKYIIKDKKSSSITTTITQKQNIELEDVCNMYKREISNKIDCSPLETDNLQKLIEEHGADKVKEAIAISVERNKKNLGYIKGILKKEAAGNSQPQEVIPPAYKEWQGDEEDEPKPQLTEEEKAELEKRAQEAREKLNSLANIITRN